MAKLRRTLYELMMGGKAYFPKKKKVKKVKKLKRVKEPYKTAGTRKVERESLNRYGTDIQSELAKIRKRGGG